jgi:phosphoglucosamine mutase
VVAVSNEPDGFNINRDCGSTHPRHLQKHVVENNADLGVAHDGDGDRVLLVDAQGQVVDGDQILYIIAMSRLGSQRLRGGVVGTLMSNLGLEQSLREKNVPFKRAQVGDRYVMALLQQEGWEIGGETSGHILCLDKTTTGDGIVSALEVLAVMAQSGRTLAQLKDGMPIYPQVMINVRMTRKFDVKGSVEVSAAVQAAEQELGTRGRVVLRASGTEPVVRVMIEGQDAAQVERLTRTLADTVKRAADAAA